MSELLVMVRSLKLGYGTGTNGVCGGVKADAGIALVPKAIAEPRPSAARRRVRIGRIRTSRAWYASGGCSGVCFNRPSTCRR